MFQCFLYAADSKEEDCNFYAMPLPISPVVSADSKQVIRIDILPTGPDNAIRPVEKYNPRPTNEYLPEYQKLRTDLKPLNVVQPEGASFSVNEQAAGSSIVDWQKWNFRVGFNQREGMVLYDVGANVWSSSYISY
jgi:primary-amine oxidase